MCHCLIQLKCISAPFSEPETTNTRTRYPTNKLYATDIIMLSLGLFLIAVLVLSFLSGGIFKQNSVMAQQYIQTIKYGNLVILSHPYIEIPTSTLVANGTDVISSILTHSANNKKTINSSNDTQVLESATNIVKLLADMVQNRLYNAINLLELTGIDPEVKNTPFVAAITKAYMGIPDNMDIQKRNIAKDILNRDKDFGSVFFTTPRGDSYIGEPYANQKQLPRLNYADRDWYKGVTSTNNTYISSVFISASIHAPATAIAVTVYSDSTTAVGNTTKSHLSGYWVGILDLRSINDDVKKLDLNQNERILVVDHTGTPIIDSYKGLNTTNAIMLMPTESIKSVLAGNAGSKIEIIDGTHIITSFQPLNAGTHIWGVVLVRPYH